MSGIQATFPPGLMFWKFCMMQWSKQQSDIRNCPNKKGFYGKFENQQKCPTAL